MALKNALDDIANKYFERHFANSMISSTWMLFFSSFSFFWTLAHRLIWNSIFASLGTRIAMHVLPLFTDISFVLTARNCSNDPFTIATHFHRDKMPSFIRRKSSTRTAHRLLFYLLPHFVYHVVAVFAYPSNFMPYQMIWAFHYNPYVCMWAIVSRANHIYIYAYIVRMWIKWYIALRFGALYASADQQE